MKPQIPAASKVRMLKSEPLANTIPEPISRVKKAKKQNTTPRMGCLRAGGSFSSRWVVPRMMYNTIKTNKVVATKIRNSYSGLSVKGKAAQITKVRNVMIASMSFSHPSFVVTIQRISQQLLQVRVRVVDVLWSSSILDYGTPGKKGAKGAFIIYLEGGLWWFPYFFLSFFWSPPPRPRSSQGFFSDPPPSRDVDLSKENIVAPPPPNSPST